ncbi:hypothetical protein ES705_35277 [subsurface metagenome]|jgi:hypothetical protein
MYKDPLVNEIRKRREDLMKKYDFDVDKIYNMIKKREKNIKDKIVSEIRIVRKAVSSESIKK